MGTSVCSYHVRGRTQVECLDALKFAECPDAFVSTPSPDWVSIVDENSEFFRLPILEKTVAKISKKLATDLIVTGVYDDDESFYVAYRRGAEVDRFATSPDVYEWMKRPKIDGNPKTLAAAFPWWKNQAILSKALKSDFKMESRRLKEIARAFGIPEHRALSKMKDLLSPLPRLLLARLPPESPLALQTQDLLSYARYYGQPS